MSDASKKSTHGGKRKGAGRPRTTDFGLVVRVGQACNAMQNAIRDRKQSKALSDLLEEKSNISEFHQYVQNIPLEERKSFLISEELAGHSEAIDDELRAIHNLKDTQDILSKIKGKRTYGENDAIYQSIAKEFGLTHNQVKNYWQEYRQFERAHQQKLE